AIYREYYQTLADAYASNLAGAQQRGEIRSGDSAAQAWALMGIAHFLGLRHAIWDTQAPPPAVPDSAFALIEHGLSPDRGASRQGGASASRVWAPTYSRVGWAPPTRPTPPGCPRRWYRRNWESSSAWWQGRLTIRRPWGCGLPRLRWQTRAWPPTPWTSSSPSPRSTRSTRCGQQASSLHTT